MTVDQLRSFAAGLDRDAHTKPVMLNNVSPAVNAGSSSEDDGYVYISAGTSPQSLTSFIGSLSGFSGTDELALNNGVTKEEVESVEYAGDVINLNV